MVTLVGPTRAKSTRASLRCLIWELSIIAVGTAGLEHATPGLRSICRPHFRYPLWTDAADITCSFPVVEREALRASGGAGAFSSNQRLVYEAVLDAQRAVIGALRPGTSWSEMHRLAERTILRRLLE